MAEPLHTNDSNTTTTYVFRFGTSDKLVCLNQQELDLIPYLSALMTHKDDFASIQNENGEYVLNYPITYTWFIAILRSVTFKQPYTLFHKLTEDNNILDTLQLFDYLGIDPFPLPLLKDAHLVRSNPTEINNDKMRVEYRKANQFEARQTAAGFIIALSKQEYYLNDRHTLQRIYQLIYSILLHGAVFGSRFRHHALTVVEKYVYPFFTKAQRRQLETTYQIIQNQNIETSMNLSNDGKPLPHDFHNTFAWRGIYVPKEEKSFFERFRKRPTWKDDYVSPFNSYSGFTLAETWTPIDNVNVLRYNRYSSFESTEALIPINSMVFDLDNFDFSFPIHNNTWPVCSNEGIDQEIFIKELQQNRKIDEAQSARSGHFNTLPKRPTVDKFKHRFGPKVQKYR